MLNTDRDGTLEEAVLGFLVVLITVIRRDRRPTAVNAAAEIS